MQKVLWLDFQNRFERKNIENKIHKTKLVLWIFYSLIKKLKSYL